MNIKPFIHTLLTAVAAFTLVACGDSQSNRESTQVETVPVTESVVATPAPDGTTTTAEAAEPKRPAGKFVPLKDTLNPESVKGGGKGED